MSIIDQGANAGQKELTKEQKQERTAMQIAKKSYETYAALIGTYKDLQQKVWNNPSGLTPQEVFDSLGTNAGELFTLSALLVQTVNSVKPNTLNPAQPYEYTINEDGTVTVGDPVVEDDGGDGGGGGGGGGA